MKTAAVIVFLLISLRIVAGDRICCNQELPLEGRITSPNGRYFLLFQHDKNLVLYRQDPTGVVALWATATIGKVSRCVMQSDGNLVMYLGSLPVWASNTYGNQNASLILQDDGNLVISKDGRNVWSTNTGQAAANRLTDRLCCDRELPIEGRIESPNGRYFLIFQADRNLVLYRRDPTASAATWATGTNGRADRCVMQSDGNLVVYNGSNPVWSSNTNGNQNASLVLQDDGKLAIYPIGQPVWVAGTGQVVQEMPVTETVITQPCELSETQYNAATKAIKGQAFKDTKLATGKQAIKNKCLTITQIRGLTKLFPFDDERLEFVKYAYDLAFDKSEYYTLTDAFSFNTTVTKFNEFLDQK